MLPILVREHSRQSSNTTAEFSAFKVTTVSNLTWSRTFSPPGAQHQSRSHPHSQQIEFSWTIRQNSHSHAVPHIFTATSPSAQNGVIIALINRVYHVHTSRGANTRSVLVYWPVASGRNLSTQPRFKHFATVALHTSHRFSHPTPPSESWTLQQIIATAAAANQKSNLASHSAADTSSFHGGGVTACSGQFSSAICSKQVRISSRSGYIVLLHRQVDTTSRSGYIVHVQQGGVTACSGHLQLTSRHHIPQRIHRPCTANRRYSM